MKQTERTRISRFSITHQKFKVQPQLIITSKNLINNYMYNKLKHKLNQRTDITQKLEKKNDGLPSMKRKISKLRSGNFIIRPSSYDFGFLCKQQKLRTYYQRNVAERKFSTKVANFFKGI